jgi:hypothetical protein
MAVAGGIGEGHDVLGLDAIAVASEGVPIAQAMRDPLPLIEHATARALRARPVPTD